MCCASHLIDLPDFFLPFYIWCPTNREENFFFYRTCDFFFNEAATAISGMWIFFFLLCKRSHLMQFWMEVTQPASIKKEVIIRCWIINTLWWMNEYCEVCMFQIKNISFQIWHWSDNKKKRVQNERNFKNKCTKQKGFFHIFVCGALWYIFFLKSKFKGKHICDEISTSPLKNNFHSTTHHTNRHCLPSVTCCAMQTKYFSPHLKNKIKRSKKNPNLCVIFAQKTFRCCIRLIQMGKLLPEK